MPAIIFASVAVFDTSVLAPVMDDLGFLSENSIMAQRTGMKKTGKKQKGSNAHLKVLKWLVFFLLILDVADFGLHRIKTFIHDARTVQLTQKEEHELSISKDSHERKFMARNEGHGADCVLVDCRAIFE